MGIPGLWAELAPAAQTTTLPSYCLTTFSDNTNSLRGLRLGIDASLWLFHAQQSSGGANPYLRLLFYRLAKLLTLPVPPLFVFDGANRPTWKRGKQVKGRQHAIEQPFTQLIEAFGYQWHRAQGEAEAELAYLDSAGFVDAVLTDDSDALLFGAQVLIRNWGKNLSGTKALSRTTSTSSDVFDDASTQNGAGPQLQLSGSDRDHLITLYRATDLLSISDLGLDRDGLVLIALMSGGDYDTTGLVQCGVKIALALARGGFGSTLIKAFKSSYPTQSSASSPCTTFSTFLTSWLEEVRNELRTNSRGHLPNRRPKLASTIVDSFLSTPESRKVLAYYIYPLTSENATAAPFAQSKSTEPDLTRLAGLSQLYFNWSKDAILAKFRTILGPGVVARRLRQEVLEYYDGAGGEGPWAALVESPASKAVRRHMLGMDYSQTPSPSTSASSSSASKAAAVAATQKKQRPLHESPNATRITDFFAKAALTTTSAAPTAPIHTIADPARNHTAPQPTVEVLAVKMQRRHAANVPFLDYRVLISMSEFATAAEAGVDPRLDAELAEARTQNDDSDTDAAGLDDDEVVAKGPSKKRVDPGEPLLMWIPEPFLQLSISGSAPLDAFLKEAERKAAATKAKGAKKAAGAGTKAGQMTLNGFVKPLAKPSLPSSVTTSKTKPSKSLGSGMPPPSQPSTAVAVPPPRTLRQLRVPSGMQRTLRRTESVPVVPLNPSTRSFDRTTSLPNRAEQGVVLSEEDEAAEDLDSSIKFLGSFVAHARTGGAVHDRSSTPPNTSSEVDEVGNRPNKSPKKSLSAGVQRSPTSFSALGSSRGKTTRVTPSARALAEPDDQDDNDVDQGEAARDVQDSFSSFGEHLARSVGRKPKPRISTITISDGSDDSL